MITFNLLSDLPLALVNRNVFGKRPRHARLGVQHGNFVSICYERAGEALCDKADVRLTVQPYSFRREPMRWLRTAT